MIVGVVSDDEHREATLEHANGRDRGDHVAFLPVAWELGVDASVEHDQHAFQTDLWNLPVKR